MNVDIHTPFSDLPRRREQMALLQLTVECKDSDFIHGLTQFNSADAMETIIEARRSKIFDYGELLFTSSAGSSWPSARSVLEAIEASKDGTLTSSSPEWIAVIVQLRLDDTAVTRRGVPIEGSDHLFELVTNFDLADDGTRKEIKKKAAPKKRKAAPKKRKAVEAPVEEAPSEDETPVPPHRVAKKERTLSIEVPDLELLEELIRDVKEVKEQQDKVLDFLPSAFDTVDKRVVGRISEVVEKLDAREGALANMFADLFRAAQVSAHLSYIVYKRQEQLDILIDKHGEFPVLDAESEEIVLGLLGVDLDAEVAEPVAEEEAEVKAEKPAPKEKKTPKKTPKKEPVAPSKQDEGGGEDGVDVLTLSADTAKMSDEDFAEALRGADDIDFSDPDILQKHSVGKLREIASRCGVPNAQSANYARLLIVKIKAALSHE
jgi:hypothetical protein